MLLLRGPLGLDAPILANLHLKKYYKVTKAVSLDAKFFFLSSFL